MKCPICKQGNLSSIFGEGRADAGMQNIKEWAKSATYTCGHESILPSKPLWDVVTEKSASPSKGE